MADLYWKIMGFSSCMFESKTKIDEYLYLSEHIICTAEERGKGHPTWWCKLQPPRNKTRSISHHLSQCSI